jgi:uncharacterized protein YjbI with pentapeptide repeats
MQTQKNPIRFRFTEQSFMGLREENVPAEILQRLRDFEDQGYVTARDFVSALERIIGKKQTDQYKSLILKYVGPYTKKDVLAWLKDRESLEYADLSGSKLIGVYLPRLNFKGASFQDADLRYAILAGAILEGVNLQGANLTGADLRGANLFEANLEHAKLDNADLLRADLRGACFKNATLTHASLRSADVSKADFTGADLRGVNLSGVKGCLSAKFSNADLRGARCDYTGLDEHELKDVGAKVDHTITGLKKRVFDYF